jgi:Flp pilus assembly pilin Flp
MEMARRLASRRGSEIGATTIEYGLMAILIAVLAVVAVGLLGESVSTLFSDAANSF